MKWFPLFPSRFPRDAIFLCPKLMKEKGKLRRWRKKSEGRRRRIHFSQPLYGFLYALVLETIHPPIGPSSLVERGRNGQVGRYIPNVSCGVFSSTLSYIRYFCSISRRPTLWEKFRQIRNEAGKEEKEEVRQFSSPFSSAFARFFPEAKRMSIKIFYLR